MSRLLPLSLMLLAASLSAGADRSRPPEPGPPRPVTLPKLERRALSNGLPVVIVELHEVPTVQVSVVFGAGAAADPAGRPGVASLTADMLDEGAGERGALELADALDGIGARLSAGAGWDSSTAGLHAPVKRLAEALPLLADTVRRPRFDPAELERLRKEALTSLVQLRDDPSSLASVALARAVFGDHRYGTLMTGDARSIASVSADDLRRFHQAHYRPGNATLLVVGDVTPSVVDLLERSFGDWPKGGVRAPDVPAPPPARERTVWLIDRPGAEQSAVRVGQVGPPRVTPTYHALEVANTLLGGLFTSRLNDNLRETHGYAYGAGSRLAYRRVAGSFFAAANVQTPSTAPALTEILKELGRIVTPAAEDEIARARSFLALSYPQEFETPGQIANQLAEKAVYGLPDDAFESYVPRVMAVGVDEAARATAGVLQPDRMAIVIVGDRAKIEAPLAALKLGRVKIVTADELLGKTAPAAR